MISAGGRPVAVPSISMFVCLLPAESLRDKFQVVVSGHELSEAGQFAHAWWDPVKVQFVRVYIQLLQFGQLTDGGLVRDTWASVKCEISS